MPIKAAARQAAKKPGNLLQVELLQEKAANLGRMARKLERALGALATHDARFAASALDAEPDARRRELLADAGDALFLYVVQREVMGLTGTAQSLDDLGIPREVRLHMAPRSVLLSR